MGKMTEEHTDKLWNSNYCKVMAANFALFFAFYLLTPLLPLYMNETFHASKGMTGMVLSGYTLTAMLFRPFSGYVVDSFQRKHVLMVCYCLFFVFFAGYLAAGKKAYRRLSRKYHPDANINNPNKDEAEEKFKEIQQAYKSIVSGEADRTGYGGASGGYGSGNSGGYGGGYGSGGYRGTYGSGSSSSGGYGQYDDPFGGFGGFGPFGFGGYQRQTDYDPNDKDSRYFQAAKNYMNSGSYEEAKNVLNQIENHDARWHYYSGVCNAGLGNQIRAMEMIKRAMELDPGNQEYRQAYESIRSGRQWYMDRGAGYGMDMPTGGKFCNNLCTICALMSCCMGGMPCVCCMPGTGGYGRN